MPSCRTRSSRARSSPRGAPSPTATLREHSSSLSPWCPPLERATSYHARVTKGRSLRPSPVLAADRTDARNPLVGIRRNLHGQTGASDATQLAKRDTLPWFLV